MYVRAPVIVCVYVSVSECVCAWVCACARVCVQADRLKLVTFIQTPKPTPPPSSKVVRASIRESQAQVAHVVSTDPLTPSHVEHRN